MTLWGSLSLPLRALRWRLFRNASYLILSSGASVTLGAAFWLVAARYYPEGELGIAAALLLVSAFIAGVANLGLGMGLIRFLPEKADRRDVLTGTLNASLTLSVALALLLGLVYVVGTPLWTPSLTFLRADFLLALVFLLVTAVYAVHPIIDSAFLAFRNARYILARNLLFGLRVPLPLVFAGVLGFMGIFLASGIGGLVAAGVALLVLLPRVIRGYRPRPNLQMGFLRPLASFSLGNKASEIAGILLVTLLPLLIIEVLSPSHAAWFYIAWFLGSALYVIPGAVSMSLFAEGSRPDAAFSRDIPRAIGGTILLMVPAAVLLWVFGSNLLSLFGPNYALEGHELLQWLILASPFVLVNSIYFTLLRVRRRIAPLVIASGFTTGFVLGWSYFLLPTQGIPIVGQAFFAAQALLAGAVAFATLLRYRRDTKESPNSHGRPAGPS